MCGIIGFASYKEIKKREYLRLGRDEIIHRGPDDYGEWWSDDGKVGFGHRRLSIIDLSKAAHQPMQDISKNLTIVFNGEIYNYLEIKKDLESMGYVFQTSSDTEVLLMAWKKWGEKCLDYINGMFSFAIYDKIKGYIFLARDRSGEKPLFYSLCNGELRFASELKALLIDPSFTHKISRKALNCYLMMGYVPGSMCIIENVAKLPPAHKMKFYYKTGKCEVSSYWEPPEFDVNAYYDENELVDELQFLLEDSVKKQLIADVPVGILLSGGIDSSLITALATKVSGNVKTFNVSFPEYTKYDESMYARFIAKYFATDHIELNAENIEPSLLKKLSRQYDEPLADSSMVPTYLVSKLVKKYCTVAIGGDGGDELFGGYHHYSRLLWIKEKSEFIPIRIRKIIANLALNFMPLGFKGRNWVEALGVDFSNELPLIGLFFDKNTRRELLKFYDEQPEHDADDIINSRIPRTNDLLQRATRMDFLNYMPEDILVKIDRASMLNSLEIRAPMLDYRILDFSLRKIPSYLKATARDRKIILKKLSQRLLPKDFDTQRKQGFSIPLEEWLKKGDWKDFFYDVLLADDCFFNKKTIIKLLNGQNRGMKNSERLFSLLIFELWRKEYKVY